MGTDDKQSKQARRKVPGELPFCCCSSVPILSMAFEQRRGSGEQKITVFTFSVRNVIIRILWRGCSFFFGAIKFYRMNYNLGIQNKEKKNYDARLNVESKTRV